MMPYLTPIDGNDWIVNFGQYVGKRLRWLAWYAPDCLNEYVACAYPEIVDEVNFALANPDDPTLQLKPLTDEEQLKEMDEAIPIRR